MLILWDKLPLEMKNESVRKYYLVLKKKSFSLVLKRIFDILMSIILIILLGGVFLVLAIAIKLDSEGSVFYKQTRVTAYNKEFKIIKFRTMVNNADEVGSLVTTEHDKRITSIGSKIRKCRLDEIPQLINILKGEMTFIGTRPEVRKYVDCYTEEMLATLLLPAGVTSITSLEFKNEDEIVEKYLKQGELIDEIYVNKILPLKMELNLKYLTDVGFGSCIKILFKTLKDVL